MKKNSTVLFCVAGNNLKSALDLSVNSSEIYEKSRTFGPSPIQICGYYLHTETFQNMRNSRLLHNSKTTWFEMVFVLVSHSTSLRYFTEVQKFWGYSLTVEVFKDIVGPLSQLGTNFVPPVGILELFSASI
jgi:hypothetical protein